MSGILVVAPHPDDDAIGCGGTIARCRDRGLDVTVVYITDGSASHPNSKSVPASALRIIREHEAIAALQILGVTQDPIFLRVPDGVVTTLPPDHRGHVVGSLADVLSATEYDAVLAPWPGEPHPDHSASAALVTEAFGRLAQPPALLWYVVWLDVFGPESDRPNAKTPYIDISLATTETSRKREALLAHVSQTTRLIDDDPSGFCASEAQIEQWLQPVERFYAPTAADIRRFNDALYPGTSAA
jgi:LmbE family N-acetylglucosaminyl deacetylase